MSNISLSTFPKQSNWLGLRVIVCFNYDTQNTILGTIVRQDIEEPGETIIRLDDERYVLATECQYRLLNAELHTKEVTQ